MLIIRTRKMATWLLFDMLLIALLVLLTGCAGPAPVATATAVTATPAPAAEAAPPTAVPATATAVPAAPALERGSDGCPLAGTGTAAISNQADAYCLLYPEGFTTEQPAEGILVISGPALDQSMEPVRAMLTIRRIGSSGGRALMDVAKEQWAEAQGEYTITDATLGGDPAVVAENLLIGEAGWKVKQVVVIHQGMTYQLTFTPVDNSPDFDKALPDIQKLWDAVFASLTFLF